MIKGAQRSIIVLKTPSGKYFEQAYFIVKDGFENKKHSKKDMVKEASRIASEAILAGGDTAVKKPSKPGLWSFFYFALGMFVCSLICGALILWFM